MGSQGDQLMTQTNDELVEFLLDTTGDTLYVVVQYGADSWEFRYVREEVRERIATWEEQIDKILGQFRADAKRNSQRKRLFNVGEFYCSLHLFNDLIIIHFSQPSGEGIIFGYDPDAASNLTAFVELCLPRIRQHALEHVDTSPTWSE